jgi:Tol biopolymer transport system component
MSRVDEASEARVLTAELIVDGSHVVGPVISPDGRWVAWTTSSAGGPEARVRELWLAPVAENAVPVRLTEGKTKLVRWSPDSAWVYYVAGEEIRRPRSPPRC